MILDTNALSAWAEGASGIESALRNADQLVLPVIALGEYEFGIRQSRSESTSSCQPDKKQSIPTFSFS